MKKEQKKIKKPDKFFCLYKCSFCGAFFKPTCIKVEERVVKELDWDEPRYDQSTKKLYEVDTWKIERQKVKKIKCPCCGNENEVIMERKKIDSYSTQEEVRAI